MQYTFSNISHIEDVLPLIKDRKEFIVAERDDYTVINYVVATNDTFPPVTDENSYHNAILRECRGLVFDKNGRLIARRLHKFFNVNEKDETQIHKIDLSIPHMILEKADGSMITPIPIGGRFRLGTKMGITDVALSAEVFIAHNPDYILFIEKIMSEGCTPIFEFCSRKHRIVVDYPEDRLILLAIRENQSGSYWSYDALLEIARQYKIDTIRQYEGTVENVNQLVENIRNEKEGEGWIIRFNDGHMVKIKTETYVRMHKVKDRIRFERNLVENILNNELDDLKSFMNENDLKKVCEYENQFWADISEFVAYVDELRFKYKDIERKTFAIEIAPNLIQPIRTLLFSLWDGGDTRQNVLTFILKNLGSNTRFNSVKFIFYNAKWEENNE